MPRRKRAVIPNVPHHVTQRGGRRQDVFFQVSDRVLYLSLFKENAERYGVQVLAYTLMTNHVHHLVVPLEHDSLRWTYQMTHKRYADFINARSGWTGHLWQQRYYSCPVDNEYLWVAIRYILRNPVEAGLAVHPVDYPWSSAKAHVTHNRDPLLTIKPEWTQLLEGRTNWYDWLSTAENGDKVSLLRKRTLQDLPMGSEQFLNDLEREHRIDARAPKLGRPKKREKS